MAEAQRCASCRCMDLVVSMHAAADGVHWAQSDLCERLRTEQLGLPSMGHVVRLGQGYAHYYSSHTVCQMHAQHWHLLQAVLDAMPSWRDSKAFQALNNRHGMLQMCLYSILLACAGTRLLH